jgi:pimeloyl-ACP methyl ester carboxylesterase
MEDQEMTPEQKFSVYMSNSYSRAFRKIIKQDKELYELLLKNRTENPPSAQDLKNQLNIMGTHDTLNDLEKISVPTLIIGGTKDGVIQFTNSELMNKKIPNSTLKTFNGLLHVPIHEAVEQVNDEIWNFIQQHS